MSLPAVLPIPPFTQPVRGAVTLPGSKSLTNRALLLAALCDQPVILTGALSSEDTELMAAALRQIGFTIETSAAGTMLKIGGQARAFGSDTAPVDIFVGLAGTAARFLTALCAAAPRGVYRLDGVAQMRKRPMQPLLAALRALGADIRCTGAEGFFPLEIRATGLRGGKVGLDASESSQLLSALLMVAPLARDRVEVTLTSGVRWSFVEMTLRLMAEFGVHAPRTVAGSAFTLTPARYISPGTYAVEPDATAASYFHALPLVVGGRLDLPGLRPPGHGLQGDAAFVDVLGRAHAHRTGQPLVEDFHEISDTFLTLAAIAPLFDRPTCITGIAHTRKQETDRVAGMARELKKLGQEVVEEDGALTITPRRAEMKTRAAAGPIEIETYGDHRFAMSFGILGCRDLRGDGQPWLAIRNPGCCAKTFPNFFELLESVRQKSLVP